MTPSIDTEKFDLPIYLDNNATTRCDPRVLEIMLPYFSEKFGNAASRTHYFGWEAEETAEYAREQVAALIGAEPVEIIFTSGATESDNLAFKGVYEMYASTGNHIITCATEHKAVLDTCKHLEKLGANITYLPVNNEGLIDVQQLQNSITSKTILISIMYANNETGVIQPIREISAVAKSHGILFMSDAVQAAGKIPVDVINDGIDLMSISAHKIYGPKGIGALYVRRKNPRVKLIAQMDGGGHEREIRAGTLNVPAIAGFGKAASLCSQEMQADAERLCCLRNKLETALLKLKDTAVNGSTKFRLPQVTNISFAGADNILNSINKDIAVSSGSACTSALIEPSYVLKAMGVKDNLAYSAIRFGLGRFTTEAQIDYVIKRVSETVVELRKENKY